MREVHREQPRLLRRRPCSVTEMSAMNYVCEVLITGFGLFWFLRDPLLLARVVKSADAGCSQEMTVMGMDGLPCQKV